jgi:hypothetical protein
MTPLGRQLAKVVHAFEHTLHLPDPGIVYLTLATAVASRLPGDPVWLVIVGPPSSGKTVVADTLLGLPWVCAVSTFTEAGLLNGSRGGRRGLLPELPERALLQVKDLTTLLSESSATRDRLFACMREVYDGRYIRELGTKRVEWEGSVGMIAAVTDAIFTVDLGIMGERFCYYCLPPSSSVDDQLACWVAGDHAGHEAAVRRDLSRKVTRLLSSLEFPSILPSMDEGDEGRLITLADLGARCRSSVVRGGVSRDIELVPQPERPMRLFNQLRRIHAALIVLGATEETIWRLLPEVALGGVHPDRRRVIEALLDAALDLATSTVGGRVGLPDTSARRHLQDLRALGIIERTGAGPERWGASAWLREQWRSIDGTWES